MNQRKKPLINEIQRQLNNDDWLQKNEIYNDKLKPIIIEYILGFKEMESSKFPGDFKKESYKSSDFIIEKLLYYTISKKFNFLYIPLIKKYLSVINYDHFLQLAVVNEHTKCVELFLKQMDSKNIRLVKNNISRFLHIATKQKNVEIVKLLLQFGAEVNFKNKVEDTPLHLTAENGQIEICKLF